jgi:hypothetical protein
MHVKRPFRRKSTLQRFADTLGDQLGAAGNVTHDLPSMGSNKAVKRGLIAAGSVAGLTAGSAAISSLRHRADPRRGDS